MSDYYCDEIKRPIEPDSCHEDAVAWQDIMEWERSRADKTEARIKELEAKVAKAKYWQKRAVVLLKDSMDYLEIISGESDHCQAERWRNIEELDKIKGMIDEVER